MNKSSFLWRSLLKGRDIVERGILWGVGDGKNINILGNKWIPSFPNRHPSLSGIHQPTPMKVRSFIDAERREWTEVMVNEMFQDEEASMILAIPLNKRIVPNKLIWNDSMIERFSVKSAYFKAREWLEKESYPYEDRSPLWKAI